MLLLALFALQRTPDPTLVGRWWPATTVATVLLLLTPRRHTNAIGGHLFLIFIAASLLAGHSVMFSVGFAFANLVEALIVVWWLTRGSEGRPELRSWADYWRWLTGISLGGAAAGLLTAASIWADQGERLWQPAVWVAITHLGAQAVVLPLVCRRPRQRVHVSFVEIGSHLVLLGLGGLICIRAGHDDPVAFLLLPLLMWAAARFTSRWASFELLGVTSFILVLNAMDAGPFHRVVAPVSVLDIAASSQAFVAVSAITVVAFSVAMCHLRDSLRTIREKEVQLGQLLDSASGTAFIATDLDGTITLFSPGAEQLLGYTAEEVVGRTSPMPFHESSEILERARELDIVPSYSVITRPLEQGAEQDTRDWTYVCKDRSRLTVSLSATAVRDPDGRPLSFLSVVRNVTDRRVAEEALVLALDREREANLRMQELDKAKGEFVSAVSHELRTPLTSIVGYTELLTDGVTGDLSHSHRELVERIDRNGTRLLNLVEDLLTLARVEQGDFELERLETDLRDAVQGAVETIAHAAAKGGVALNVVLPDNPAVLVGDPAGLERLVVNLLSNAVKFTDSGGSVDVILGVSDKDITLVVRDTGMGIPLEEQDQLFQRFFRSSLATKNAVQGTGLGLNIVRSIAEAHHGDIAFESAPGVGTTFRLTLPLHTAEVEAPPVDPAEPASEGEPEMALILVHPVEQEPR